MLIVGLYKDTRLLDGLIAIYIYRRETFAVRKQTLL